MKKLILFILLLVIPFTFVSAQNIPLTMAYWIIGEIEDIPELPADGIKVNFYAIDEQISDNPDAIYAQATVVNNKFFINAFDIWPEAPIVDNRYILATEQVDGYGASATITISGIGYDDAGSLELELGEGLPGSPRSRPRVGSGGGRDGEAGRDGEGRDGEEGDVDLAQKGTLAGKVVDPNGDPVAVVLVSLEGTSLNTFSSIIGDYSFTGIDPATYSISASKQWYIPNTVSDIAIVAGETTSQNITIEKIKETPPQIGQIRFGNRVYFKHLVERGQAFVVGPNPRVSVAIKGQDEFGVNTNSLSIIKDFGAADSYTYDVSAAEVMAQTAASGMVNGMSVTYDIPQNQPLAEGLERDEVHYLSFEIFSAGQKGTATSTMETVALTVMGGPLRVIGSPLTFPAPFRRSADSEVTIQYTLSEDADIDLYIYSVEGRIVKKEMVASGTEGGSAGVNKVTWDTITQIGHQAGAGVYVGSIVAREENRVLAKFKVAIVE